MNLTSHNTEHQYTKNPGKDTNSKLEAISWGLFFLWVGATFLFGFSTGIGLLGIGLITLGMQWVRKFFGLNAEGFWIVIGSLFTLGGLGILLELEIQPLAIIFILVGVLIFASVFRAKD